MTNFQTRVLVALFGIPLIVAASYIGGIFFFFLVTLVSSFALLEFYALAAAKGSRPLVRTGIIAGLVLNVSFYHDKLQLIIFEVTGNAFAFPSQTQLFFTVYIVIAVVLCLMELFRKTDSPLLNVGTTLQGITYVPLLLGTLIGLRELFLPLSFPMWQYFPGDIGSYDRNTVMQAYRWGGQTVIALFACIWICDTAAYVVGRSVGKHRLLERVSPNKTWEGALAGLLAAVGTAIAAKFWLIEYLTLGQACMFGIIVGIFGQAGDLVESLFKRDAGVKDSSTIIPGHGGMLDRFDSLIFASPMVYLYLDFVVFS